MAAILRNPSSGGQTPVLDEFPSGAQGRQFFHSGFACAFVHDGARWKTLDGGAAVYPAANTVAELKLLRLVDGTLELFDVSVHTRATGVCVSIVDSDALVRWSGEVDGFVGLTPGSTYASSDTPGELTDAPGEGYALVRAGVAMLSTRLLVALDQPIL